LVRKEGKEGNGKGYLRLAVKDHVRVDRHSVKFKRSNAGTAKPAIQLFKTTRDLPLLKA
jgi:hypothetical protein